MTRHDGTDTTGLVNYDVNGRLGRSAGCRWRGLNDRATLTRSSSQPRPVAIRTCNFVLINDSKMRIVALFLLLGLAPMYSSAQSPVESANPQEAAAKATYLVLYRPGPAWLIGKSVMEQPLKEHGKYMLSLYIKGSMKLAGPLTDDAGGAVLLEVSNEAEAKAIVANDPAVKSGVFVYEMHPWKLLPWEKLKAKAAAQ